MITFGMGLHFRGLVMATFSNEQPSKAGLLAPWGFTFQATPANGKAGVLPHVQV
jgi:hypothetical protein